MKYYVGIDGGGTKTEFCLADQSGKVLAQLRRGSASYKQIEDKGVVTLLKEGFIELQQMSGISCSHEIDSIHTCFGMPLFGENRKHDENIACLIQKELSEYHIKLVNDVEVGWAGSLNMQEGINIVAGTGSIAFGKNKDGVQAKAGGWSEFFSDEGSCYWLGKKAVEYYSKEADGRLKKDKLYELFNKKFRLKNNYDIIEIIEEEYMPFRDKVASLQMILMEAAVQGDESARNLYAEAAFELALIVKAVYRSLNMKNGCRVSYSGGLFQVGALVLKPFEAYLKPLAVTLAAPENSPVQGAVFLAKYYENRE